uniref:Lysozyme n=1 Tax=Acrobeloides nanus TaxID=290746 RepID=A0A914C6B6_9BILA
MYRVFGVIAIVLTTFSTSCSGQTVLGVDAAATSISTSQFQCLLNNGYKLFVGRIGQISGPDTSGIQNIRNAQSAGVPYTHAFIFPSAQQNATVQVDNAIAALGSTYVKVLWLDVEKGDWGSNKTANEQFLIQLWHAAAKYLYINYDRVGIYTSVNNWNQIIGTNSVGDYFYQFPIWYVYANSNVDPCNGWLNFGGWLYGCLDEVVHKYAINVNICGTTVDLNAAAWVGWRTNNGTSV